MIGIVLSLALLQAAPDGEFPRDADLTKFRDIKPHQTIPVSTPDVSSSIVLPVLIGFALLGCIALLLWFVYRRTPDPNLLAMAEVDRLETLYSADPKQAYGQLSSLVRERISQPISGNPMSQSTDQVIDSLQSYGAPDHLVERTGKLLRLADESKFACRGEGVDTDERVDPDECIFDLARSIVQAHATRSVRNAEGDQ